MSLKTESLLYVFIFVIVFFVFKTTCFIGIGFLKKVSFFLICPCDCFFVFHTTCYEGGMEGGMFFFKFILVFLFSLYLYFHSVDKRRKILKHFYFVFVYVCVSNHLLEEESF